MHVVVVSDKRPERDGIARALQAASMRVELASDPKVACGIIGHEPPAVLIVGWPASGGPDLLRLLRGADRSGHMYVLAVLDPTPGGRDVAPVLAAGAHDFIRRPLVDAELVARVQAPGRLYRWAKSVTKATTFDLSSGVDLTRLAMWKQLGEIVAEDVAQLVGQTVEARPGWPAHFGRDVRCATIPMSLASDKTEVRVSIAADGPTRRWLGAALLGDPSASEANLDDVLRELANTAGGAVKRAALPENVTLTTGIPVNEGAIRPSGPGIQAFTLPLDAGKTSLAVVGEIRRRDNQRVPAAGLREGMVLVHDVRSESGALLVTAGTRLTSTTAERLAGMFGPKFVVEVVCAA